MGISLHGSYGAVEDILLQATEILSDLLFYFILHFLEKYYFVGGSVLTEFLLGFSPLRRRDDVTVVN